MSPTTRFSPPYMPVHPCSRECSTARCGRGVPGVGEDWVGTGGVLPGYSTQPSQDPYFSHILRLGPTHGQMKRFLRFMMRFPRIDPRIDPRMT